MARLIVQMPGHFSAQLAPLCLPGYIGGMSYQIIDTGRDRESWLGTRRTGVSATDIARLMTGGAAVRAAIRAEKNGHERHFETEATRHGKDRERHLASFAYDMFGMGHNVALLAADDERRFICTPDLLGVDEVGDIKTTVHDWNDWPDVPKRYTFQLWWQMRVTGARRARLVYEPHVGFRPIYPEPKVLTLDWDEASILLMEQTAREFMEWDGEPDPDAAELEALLAAYIEEKELADQATAALEARAARIEEYLEHQPRKFEGSVANLTRSADSFSTRADTDKMRAAGVYDTYTKKVRTKGRLTITPRKDEA